MSVVLGEGSIDDSGTEEDIFYSDDEEYIYYESNNDEEDSGEDAEGTCEDIENARSKLHKKISGRGHQKLGDKSLMKHGRKN